MCRGCKANVAFVVNCLGQSSHNGYLVHRSKVGLPAIVAGCIGAHLAVGKVKPEECVMDVWTLNRYSDLHLYLTTMLTRVYQTVMLDRISFSIQLSYPQYSPYPRI